MFKRKPNNKAGFKVYKSNDLPLIILVNVCTFLLPIGIFLLMGFTVSGLSNVILAAFHSDIRLVWWQGSAILLLLRILRILPTNFKQNKE